MSLLRAELIGKGNITKYSLNDGSLGVKFSGVYDGIIESVNDLSLPRLIEFSPGSLMYCLADKGVYVKTPSGSWEAAV